MHLHTRVRRSLFGKVTASKGWFGKAAIATATLGALLFFAGAPAAKAADPGDCGRRIARAEHRLHEAVEHHGYYSRQADHQRHELNEARERCGGYRYRYYDRDRY